ncbi:hypothetical protein PLESTB_001124000 [Pleodorina starrii]|uniref:Uncharacterized protein n=1 Tax=Pleodorina starrii TaxID=330485 RepID=A0A9W6BR47_9CHLO|nr:hypothetical protein PLESTM_001361300 [Pleodorina starrii]GLC56588.1 hypothetical protein PLESTB_001124000 [Pleodorina starrii]GLC76176.1 hypothetical protein PLESTF_001746300 [Pleodorina starrii]
MRSCSRLVRNPQHASFAKRGKRLVCNQAVSASAPPLHQSSSSSSAPSDGKTLRRLILLRHADSDQTSGVRDHDRTISETGRRQASQVAQLLKDKGWTPDLVLASNSKRTKQTLDEMCEVIEELGVVDAHYYGSLYTVAALDGQTREHICDCLLEVIDDVRNKVVMCVGHNKGWEEAASQFSGTAVKLKTASAALLQCYSASWKDVLQESAQWQLVEVLVPAV